MSNWDYEHPSNAWESMPWFIRWPIAIAFSIYFVGGIIAGILGLLGFHI